MIKSSIAERPDASWWQIVIVYVLIGIVSAASAILSAVGIVLSVAALTTVVWLMIRFLIHHFPI